MEQKNKLMINDEQLIILDNTYMSNIFDYLKEGRLVNSISPLFVGLYLYVTKSHNFTKS